MSTHIGWTALRQAVLASAAMLAVASAPSIAADATPAAAAARARPAQSTFASPEDAAAALAAAMRADDVKAIWRILGPGARKVARSGDPVQDNDLREAFVEGYDRSARFERSGDARALLLIGPQDFPFPYPLVARDARWRFDARNGDEEVLNRRIGRNELSAIGVCLAYLDAQREFAARDRSGNGLLEYAQKLISTPGKHDGLFWETGEGEAPSPLGPLIARARGQGYAQGPADPYHGYLYKILTGQGRDAPGGEYDYLVRGKMIGGFALVAYPARWGASGVMTFACSHDGVVYEKNLGKDTQAIAAKMTLFNPDGSWTRSKDQ